jgi:glycopeptide antibiotics resistance protein
VVTDDDRGRAADIPVEESIPRRHPRGTRIRLTVSALLLAGYITVVLAVTLSPAPIDSGFRPAIVELLSIIHSVGVPGWFGYRELESCANVALFVPLAFFVAMLLPGRLAWVTLLVGPLVSIAIELTQAIFLSQRFASAGDVLANSVGTVLGVGLAFATRSAVRKYRRTIARAT